MVMRRCRGDSEGVTLARTGHLEMISVILLGKGEFKITNFDLSFLKWLLA